MSSKNETNSLSLEQAIFIDDGAIDNILLKIILFSYDTYGDIYFILMYELTQTYR